MRLSVETRRSLVREAALAPTVHNVQPARWAIDADGTVRLLRDRARRLPVADPTGRDVRVSLGAAWEGLGLAASRRGLTLSEPSFVSDDDPDTVLDADTGADPETGPYAVPNGGPNDRTHDSPDLAPDESPDDDGRHALVGIAAGELRQRAGGDDPLARRVAERASWRGEFEPPTDAARAAARRLAADDVIVVTGPLDRYAELHDEASWEFLREPDYEAELYGWLRLSRRHPDWDRDGLNADALALSYVERLAAAVALRPAVFRAVRRIGAARALASEARQVRSAAALLLYAPPATTDDFPAGRRFYRLWLEATSLGLALAPMSALADSEAAAAALRRWHGIGEDRRLVNVFRAGIAPPRAIRPARLPAEEVLVAGRTP